MNRVNVSIDRLRQLAHRAEHRPARIPADERSCPRCESHYSAEEMRRNFRVCPACGHHFPAGAHDRLDQLAGPGGWTELWPGLRAADPLGFYDLKAYSDRAQDAEAQTGLGEAIVCAELEVRGRPAVAAIMDFAFMGGSMGAVVGEKLARACDHAAGRALPLLIVTASGGARMQEGVLALMQMAKSVIALDGLAEAGQPVIVVLAHPTTGGVWASFASLGDVIYAEPGALIAFSGPRVIEQTTREKLAPDFGKAELQLHNGQVDAVVDRREMPERIARVLGILHRPQRQQPPGAPGPVQWAQEGAGRAARAAQSIPGLSRRLVDRIRPGHDGDGS
ncbi:MAG: acetyl-CoA carboxylase carboxyl transferase subunit beta [Thermoleophilia bacterium]|nr:acetyl-CoA carboxylase carboxyl transferase subunit beta [Thermoleophilia bacterium]